MKTETNEINPQQYPKQTDCNPLQYLLLLLSDFAEVWLLPHVNYQNKQYCERGRGGGVLRRVRELIGRKAQEIVIKC